MTSLVIQEKLPEGVNLPLGPSTVCTSLKTKGHVRQCFLPHGKVMPDTSLELNLEWTSMSLMFLSLRYEIREVFLETNNPLPRLDLACGNSSPQCL